jgi:hypothetical protein
LLLLLLLALLLLLLLLALLLLLLLLLEYLHARIVQPETLFFTGAPVRSVHIGHMEHDAC